MKIRTLTFLKRQASVNLLKGLMLAFVFLSIGQTARAQNAKLHLSQLNKLAQQATEATNVSLEGPMLQMAAQQAHSVHTAGLLRGLKGVYVKDFQFAKPGQYSKSDLESVLKQLQSGGWKPMVTDVNKKSGETAAVYVMEEGGEIVGLAVVDAEPEELAIVNLVGPIDFAKLGGLESLGSLGSLGSALGGSSAPGPQLHRRTARPNGTGN